VEVAPVGWVGGWVEEVVVVEAVGWVRGCVGEVLRHSGWGCGD
jgi:hypothetical protein